MNEIYEIEDEDDWTTRKCSKCRFKKPFSFGFNAEECKPCTEIKDIVEVSDSYVGFFYDDACRLTDGGDDTDGNEQTDGQTSGQSTNTGTSTDTDGEVTEEVLPEDEGSTTLLIIIAVVIVLIILGVFLFYKFYLVPKNIEKRMSQAPI